MSADKCFFVGIFCLFTSCLVIAAPPAVHPATGEPLVIDVLRGEPDAIDGDLSDWDLEALTPAVLDTVEQISPDTPDGATYWDNLADCSAKFYLLWDDRNIYIAAVVKDDALSMNKTGVDIWNADCVEVFFSTTNAVAGHAEHYQYGFNANEQKWNWCNMAGAGDTEPDYLQIASSQTADGYICEVAIPHAEMTPLEFMGGSTIGFHPVIDDTESGDREIQMTWTGRAAHDQTLGYGHIRLISYKSSAPNPADGSTVPAKNDLPPNAYMILDYRPGLGAITNTVYFSDVKQDVIDRDEDHCLGSIPPWPEWSDTAFVVGFDDPGIPEYARTPLVPGKTYYWAVDCNDGTTVWPGDVWRFTVMSEAAWGPDPYDGEEMVHTNGTMTWQLGYVDTTGATLSYNIYIGTDETAVAGVATGDTTSPLYAGNVGTESYEYSQLAGGTEIFWRVDTSLTLTRPPFTETITKGSVWSFTTIPAPPVVPIVEEDLVGWWKLDGDVVLYWIFDSSGYANHGEPRGNPTFVPGFIDNALDFDGGGDFVYTGKNAADLGIEGNNPKSVSVWVKPRSFNNGAIWDLGTRADGQNFCLRTNVDETHPSSEQWWRVQYWGGDDVDFQYETLNEWVHFGHVHDGTSTRVYANGEMVVDEPRTLNTSANNPFQLGCYGWQESYFDGLIDDFRLYKRALSAKELRILGGLLIPVGPDPADGATDVPRKPTLIWWPGVYAAAVNGNVVYYSADKSAVVNRTAPNDIVSTPTLVLPLTLDLGQTFYWAVDTVNGVDTWPGDLWTFTTVNWLSVDDMETYTPWTTAGNNIFETWRDGEGNCAPGNGNDTGASLSTNEDSAYIRSGLKSMKYDFDNDGMVYSPCDLIQKPRTYLYAKIEAQVAGLPSNIGTDWTVEGVKALQINFMGQAGNAMTEPLWAQLQDSSKTYGTKVFYGDQEGEDMADFNDASWHQWDIDLADLNVDLENVVSIVIGIGNEGATSLGGSGTIYIDDIRLYTPRCMPNRAKPDADFDNSCQVDYPDLAALFDNWLLPNLPEDDIVDFEDYAELLNHWLEQVFWP